MVASVAGVTLYDAVDINQAGQVLAEGCDSPGENCRPYLLTPVTTR